MGYIPKVALYETVTVATANIVELATVKANANIDHDDDDAIIQLYIDTATEEVERLTNRLLNAVSLRGNYPGFKVVSTEYDYFVELERAPVRQVTAVQRFDVQTNDYVDISTDDYEIRQTSTFWRVLFYPYSAVNFIGITATGQRVPYPIRVTFDAGYADVNSVPNKIKMAIIHYATWLYNNRGDCADEKLPDHIDRLIGGCRVLRHY